MQDYTIKVGIKTDGRPILRQGNGHTVLANMLIGDGFHWERSVEAVLPGAIELYHGEEGGDADSRVTLINSLPLETYLEAVVGSEMNPGAPIEFLKAHAVISRSWALGKILNCHHRGGCEPQTASDTVIGWDDTAGHSGFHVCSDDHCQRYQGVQPISPRALEAIRSTAGEVLRDPDGRLVDARFSKCCGGHTELFSTCWQDEDQACLESFDDPWCDLTTLPQADREAVLSVILKDYDLHSTHGYGFRWQEEVAKTLVEENLRERFGRSVGKVVGIEPLRRGPSERISLLRVTGTDGHLDIGKELWIRRLLSTSHLYSSAFEVEDRGDTLMLTGRGWGHGVGLCQIGAANMAVNGHDYRAILSFYYPASSIE